MDGLVRLNKYISQTGEYSRHEADRLITDGYVVVNGEIAVSGMKVPISGCEVKVNGRLLGERRIELYKFYKPRGFLSSYYDPNGKKNLSSFKFLADRRLGYSGRLDYESEGLMIFTNDGDLIYKLQRSEYGVEKEYYVETDVDISDSWIFKLERGILDLGEQFLPCKVSRISPLKYSVILTEGKKRQVRRMFFAAGAKVKKLLRKRIGCIRLCDMRPGEFIPLAKKEAAELNKCIESK